MQKIIRDIDDKLNKVKQIKTVKIDKSKKRRLKAKIQEIINKEYKWQ